MMHQPSLPGLEDPGPIPAGKLGDIYEALPLEEREPYLLALRDRTVPAEHLSQAVAQLGFQVSPSLIRTHRRLHDQ